tara:strand:+ start:149 stop:373 length:225 start_codon:yes stop_codon:yes gene_type:complete
MKKNFLIISGVTFGVFFAEALIHYNYGILESKNMPFKWENWTMPKGKSLVKMAAIVLVASALSGIIIEKVEQQV